MRRSTDYTKIVIVAIVVVVAIGFIFMKVLSNDSTKDFKNYVAKYQEAIESYSTKIYQNHIIRFIHMMS